MFVIYLFHVLYILMKKLIRRYPERNVTLSLDLFRLDYVIFIFLGLKLFITNPIQNMFNEK